MTTLSLPPQVTPRLAYWLGLDERTELAETIVTVLRDTVVLPSARDTFEAVLTELGVAQARDVVWPERAKQVRAAAKMADDVLPVRISDQELAVIASLPLSATLSRALRAQGY